MLANNLLKAGPKNELENRTHAIKELVLYQSWRQQFQVYGTKASLTYKTEQRLTQWGSSSTSLDTKLWSVIVLLFTITSLSLLLLFIFSIIPINLYGSLFLLLTAGSFYIGRKATPAHNQLSNIVNEIDTIYKQINHIQNEKFKSDLLQEIQQNLSLQHHSASGKIKELKQILNRFDYRLNLIVAILLNALFLWDIRQLLSLEKWKKQNRDLLPKCFNALATMEVLNSLSTLAYNNPEWCFPEWKEDYFTFSGSEIGHPLILKEKRVDNSFSMKGTGKVAMVTGSNMSGKSTFLRTIGANMVLAHMGAPVCAVAFTTSYIQLMTSMRITDNLAENTSTFYAELKKLETIINAVNNKEQVFILLDEILRGTNSMDRHIGSKAMIKQLIHKNSAAIIASHDLELAALEESFPEALSNYHFDVQVEGEELFFDYKLKKGVCQSLNASLLMKKIGIEL
jgi:DNA mismatch repair ATPase MutS